MTRRRFHIITWNSCQAFGQVPFTKYKRNLHHGFRLENMSWRLWYRETRLRKTSLPNTNTMELPSAQLDHKDTLPHTRLTRSRSLPSLSYPSQVLAQPTTSIDTPTYSAVSPPQPKFFVGLDDDESDLDDEEEWVNQRWCMDDDEEDMVSLEDSGEFSSCGSSVIDEDDLAEPKQPISLLTSLLQKQAVAAAASIKSLPDASPCLRRSHCHGRLDQWFSQQQTTLL
ncbi:hypothetical protein DM01DRAFT_1101391 [Hesseltinella vesiculosa]|uniref:Nitrogen regulatory protein areA GATA-like domain-containing protein n=1 Tax=Hesseltinella vesiculosa TaxID=101127 RepID=A0A1X2GBB9_9FUNG|nr:hypothetical protein DM01DRAFT_1101391 [Hesseltinella vesiculosa]